MKILTVTWLSEERLAALSRLRMPCLVDRDNSELILVSFDQSGYQSLWLWCIRFESFFPKRAVFVLLFNYVAGYGGTAIGEWLFPG